MARGQATATGGSRKKTTAKKSAPAKPVWVRIADGFLLFFDFFAVIAMIITGYAGMVSPLKHNSLWGVLPLGFPIVLAVAATLAVIQLFHYRRGLIILGVGLLICGGPFLDFFPLHITDSKPSADSETFTMLTYNVGNFNSGRTSHASGCAALAYILERDADIVCIQEAQFTPTADNHITAAQLDSMHARYPHVILSGKNQALLSKFPVQVLHLDSGNETFGNGDIGAYRLTLPSGKLISLFNVHLYSYSLDPDDKKLYKNLTKLKHESISEVRSQLIQKLRIAAVGRAREALQIQRWVRLYGGPESIIAGDFNDVQGCYTIRLMEESGFQDAYPRVGFGPMITFNNDRFYFCIDHVLSRGDLKPLWLHKGRTHASDHYPLMVEFEVQKR